MSCVYLFKQERLILLVSNLIEEGAVQCIVELLDQACTGNTAGEVRMGTP